MRIVILGDSLALPRPHRINEYSPNEIELAVNYEETYSSILGSQLNNENNMNPYIEVINRAQRFSTIKDIHKQFSDHLFFFKPDIIVLQVGIVDCWRRDELNGRQLVEINDFQTYFTNIVDKLRLRLNTKLIIIGISPTSVKMDKRYNGINKEVAKYNNVLKNKVDNNQIFYISLEDVVQPENTAEYLLPDDHHLNKNGNVYVAGKLKEIVQAVMISHLGVRIYNEGNHAEALSKFEESFAIYPFYHDNLYNLQVLSITENRVDNLKKIAEFADETIL